MGTILRRAVAIATLCALGVGLALTGAQSAASAALLAVVLLALTVAGGALASREVLAMRLAEYAVPGLAFVVFCGLALASTAMGPVAQGGLFAPHPLWADMGLDRGAMSLSPYRTIEGVAAFLGVAAAFALGALCVRNRADKEIIARGVVVVTLALCAYALFLYANNLIGRAHRLELNFGSPNAAATTFAVLAVSNAALALRAASGKTSGYITASESVPAWLALMVRAPFSLAALIGASACILMTGSRAGILAAAAGVLAFITLAAWRARSRTHAAPQLVVFGAIVGLVGVIGYLGRNFAMRRLGLLDVDAQVRSEIFTEHWRAFLERPIFGHGLNTFHEINTRAQTPANFEELREMGAAHNIYVQLLEETGVVGAGVFAIILGPLLWRAARGALTSQSGYEWSAAACGASVAVLLHGAVDFGLQVPAIAALYAFILAAYASPTLHTEKDLSSPPSES